MPDKEKLKIFLECFEKLSNYEANMRMVRGYGCFNPKDLARLAENNKEILSWLGDLIDSSRVGTG